MTCSSGIDFILAISWDILGVSVEQWVVHCTKVSSSIRSLVSHHLRFVSSIIFIVLAAAVNALRQSKLSEQCYADAALDILYLVHYRHLGCFWWVGEVLLECTCFSLVYFRIYSNAKLKLSVYEIMQLTWFFLSEWIVFSLEHERHRLMPFTLQVCEEKWELVSR